MRNVNPYVRPQILSFGFISLGLFGQFLGLLGQSFSKSDINGANKFRSGHPKNGPVKGQNVLWSQIFAIFGA